MEAGRSRPRIRKAATWALCVAIGATVALPAPSAHAQQPGKAERDEAAGRFKKGYELFKEGDFEAALIEFRRAYELSPNYAVLYNIGQVYFQLQDYARALESLEQYLEEGGNKIPPKRRKEVEGDIDKLKTRVARLEIVTNVTGAEISIDDAVVGTTPLAEPVVVSAGRRRIAAVKEGRMPVRKVIEVAGEEARTIKLDLPELAKGQPSVVYVEGEEGARPRPQPDQPKPETSPDIPWLAWGITAGLGVATGAFAVVTLVSENDLTSKREDQPATADELDSASTQTTAFAAVTDILLASTIIAAGISTFLTIDALSSEPTADGARVTTRVGVVPGGMTLRTDF